MKQTLFLDVAEEQIKKTNYLLEEKKKRNIKTKHFKVTDENKKIIKRSKGDYFTIVYNKDIVRKFPKSISKEIASVLNKILKSYKKYGKTLIIGLGNSSILADALGPITTNKIIATNHFNDFLTIPKIALFVPEVIGKTGISSYKLIEMVVNNLKPDTIIVIDSLATINKERLNYCIEISDTGIVPGSALRSNREINAKTFGIPVIAIGVPLMINYNGELYTTPNISEVITQTSDIIANAINSIYLA